MVTGDDAMQPSLYMAYTVWARANVQYKNDLNDEL